MNRRLGSILPGLIIIVIGLWFLARNFNVPLPDIASLWPALPVIFGLAAIFDYFSSGRQDSGKVFVGAAAILAGLFFFMFTLGKFRWGNMDRYWPVFVLIGGVSFLAQWVAEPSRRGLLLPAAIALIVGLVFLPSTLGVINPALANQIIRLWPAALIAAGLGVLISSMFRGSRSA